MSVLGLLSISLEVPELEAGVRFYTEAGLEAAVSAGQARFRCPGQEHDCITLLATGARKRLHHVAMRVEDPIGTAERAALAGGERVPAPDRHDNASIWVRDPHGLLFRLADVGPEPGLPQGAEFVVNAPGRITRRNRAAVPPRSAQARVRPLRLGHVALFTPDVAVSKGFLIDGLGMGLADHSGEEVAFCCARKDSDHHVIALARSEGVGFHHVSFQVNDPDEVGRAGRALVAATGAPSWGLGRHTIGSNFFHYIGDPWGSWLEYYSDMDFIEDHAAWEPTNYALADSMSSWAPELPPEFGRNREVTGGE